MWSVLSYGIIVNTGLGQPGAGILTDVVGVILWYYSKYGPWPAGGRDSHICGRCDPMVLEYIRAAAVAVAGPGPGFSHMWSV